MSRSKNVYNKLDLETYNKYNIENDNAIEIMDKDNRHHAGWAHGLVGRGFRATWIGVV